MKLIIPHLYCIFCNSIEYCMHIWSAQQVTVGCTALQCIASREYLTLVGTCRPGQCWWCCGQCTLTPGWGQDRGASNLGSRGLGHIDNPYSLVRCIFSKHVFYSMLFTIHVSAFSYALGILYRSIQYWFLYALGILYHSIQYWFQLSWDKNATIFRYM